MSTIAARRDDVERICSHLADRIEANGSRRPSTTTAWRTSARLLIDADHRTEQQIHTAIDWCQNDEFWRSNILSMRKLRAKYDQLRLQAQRQAGSNGNGHMTASDKAHGWLALGEDRPQLPAGEPA